MEVSFDLEKRAWTLAERQRDFADAAKVFVKTTLTQEDDRFDYPELQSDLWPARRTAGADGMDADRRRHPRDFDEELP